LTSVQIVSGERVIHRSRWSVWPAEPRKRLTPERFILVVLIGLGTALLATLTPSSSASASSGRSTVRTSAMTLHPCPGLTGVECGTVEVPQYWTDPGVGTFTVHFRVYRHTDRSLPALEPIVTMEGGPGLASIESANAYKYMIGTLLERHDLIVMDNRGTGLSDPIDCPGLQNYFALSHRGDLVSLVQACARQLGTAANAYGTVAVGDDLAFILSLLGIHKVDVYGDSYGDYSAQVFTLDHASLVRSLVLDGSYNNSYRPFEQEDVSAMRRAWTLLCERSSSCDGENMVKEIASFSLRLKAHPLVTTVVGDDGKPVQVDLTATAFAQLVYDATYTYTDFRDLPAALTAFTDGDRNPLLRLAAEDVDYNASGSAPGDSIGDLEAVSCTDYPQVWNPAASVPVRRKELATAIADLESDIFSPFTKSVYLNSYDENELVFGCLDWKTSPLSQPTFPAGIHYPRTPVLIFDGQFDQATPVADALKVVHSWPNSTFVEVANSNHVTAEGDFQDCTSVILQRFIETLSAGNTSCARAMPPVTVVPAFPQHLTEAPVPHSVGSGAQAKLGRQAGWVGAQTAGDVLARWFNLGYGSSNAGGRCLYGGAFKSHGPYFFTGPRSFTLHKCLFVEDLSVSGKVVWNDATQAVDATLRVQGPGGATGSLTVHWRTGIYNWQASTTVTGEYGGNRVDVQLSAPWVPQS
jgi:pimeloyl-ACP methyl ester carboxylesterase